MKEDWNKIKVSLKNSETECYVNVPFVDVEGKLETPLTPQEVRLALSNAGVVHGVRQESIKALFEEGKFDQEVLVAEGTPPTDGQDGRIEYFFDHKRDYQPTEDEDGRIDFHAVSLFVPVAKGDELCRLHPPVEGAPGKTVTGNEIQPRSGRERLIPQGPRTEVSPTDPYLLISASNGCVALNSSNLVQVEPTLHIKGDVDFNTGNVKFVGSLSIGGDIKSGFQVVVKGDLDVGGCVEDAEVEVEGSMLLRKGFIGRGKGKIKTTGDLMVKYVHGQNIECGGRLQVGGELMHSQVRSVGDVIANSRKGAILGGKVETEGNIETTTLGSTSYVHTEVVVGADFKLLDRLNEIEEEVKKVEENKAKVKKALYNLSILKTKLKGQLSAEHQTLFDRLNETSRYYPKYKEELEEERKRINRDIASHKDVCVRVNRTLFPGVRVSIGRFSRVFKEATEGACLREIRGEIVPTT